MAPESPDSMVATACRLVCHHQVGPTRGMFAACSLCPKLTITSSPCHLVPSLASRTQLNTTNHLPASPGRADDWPFLYRSTEKCSGLVLHDVGAGPRYPRSPYLKSGPWVIRWIRPTLPVVDTLCNPPCHLWLVAVCSPRPKLSPIQPLQTIRCISVRAWKVYGRSDS